MNQRLILLHGFAGSPLDWKDFDATFSDWSPLKINLFNHKPQPFRAWADTMAQKLADFDGRQALLGYSLGGRLAAHLVAQAPALFAGAIFVSVNPGLKKEAERLERRDADEIWATKWASQPWADLQNEWNAQAVFQSAYSRVPIRDEAMFDRTLLSEALRVWSLGEQTDLRSELVASSVPQLWLAGQDDQKFVKLGEEMAGFSTRVQFKALPRAGHRAPWDNPPAFVAAVTSFLESL